MKLAERYRPASFDQVIGQDTVVSILRNIVRKKSYQYAYMFSGPSSIGKTTMGRIFAKAILCDHPSDGNPCNNCESCRLFDKDQNFSYRELDSASYGGKEDMVKLRDDAAFISVEKKKIILLDECHDISRQGQDALLKQLEQCPDHLIYIFCTTEPDNVKETVRKRCMQFQVARIDPNLIKNRLAEICLKEGFKHEDPALEAIALESRGQVRDAINILEELAYLGEITLENYGKISHNHDQQVCNLLLGLGSNLSNSLTACKELSSRISAQEVYDQILSMLSDTAKVLYGYDDFVPQRKKYLDRIRDVHGFRVLEFMNYLVHRNKYVDKSGLQADIVLLHYKFCSDGFKPQMAVKAPVEVAQAPMMADISTKTTPTDGQTQPSVNTMTHAQLQKLSQSNKARVLREEHKLEQKIKKEDTEKRVPSEWPLPKEERIGDYLEDKQLSPEEFSQQLVGGRGGVQ